MFVAIGKPSRRLSDLPENLPITELKGRMSVAVIDDNPFTRLESLRNHGFRLDELGGDIRSVTQLASYPVIVCDIRGVAPAFQSEYEGAHLIAEIRKAYPDKYLIAFTAQTYSIKYNALLAAADEALEKDVSADVWNKALTNALNAVGGPKSRWIRFRTHLSAQGVDAYDLFRMEQAVLKAVDAKDADLMTRDKAIMNLPPYLKPVAVAFAETAIKLALESLAN